MNHENLTQKFFYELGVKDSETNRWVNRGEHNKTHMQRNSSAIIKTRAETMTTMNQPVDRLKMYFFDHLLIVLEFWDLSNKKRQKASLMWGFTASFCFT